MILQRGSSKNETCFTVGKKEKQESEGFFRGTGVNKEINGTWKYGIQLLQMQEVFFSLSNLKIRITACNSGHITSLSLYHETISFNNTTFRKV